MESHNIGVGRILRIAVEFVALAILLLIGSASAMTPTTTNHQPANISNDNGSNIQEWIINDHPTTYFKGNRIWDSSRPDEFALTYSWDPMSFSGFYYNTKDDVGTEKLTMTLGDYTTRTILKNNLVYTTSPQEVSFAHSGFGKYQILGFMADKYFAAYTANTSSTKTRPTTNFDGISALSQGELHKVLIDDNIKRTISVGGTLAMQDGYVLKARGIDLNNRTMFMSLLKDGNEVDVFPLSADETYVYSKNVSGIENLPLIMVRFDSVFSGQELQVAFIKGLFQISEDATLVKSGNQFDSMEVTSVSHNGIEMKNSADIGLNKSTTTDIMGDVKIKVADNDSVVRFALSVEKTGNLEVRSSVYTSNDITPIREWTPYNFGMNIGQTSAGFYYDLDDGVGSEKLTLTAPVSGRNISDKNLEYSTSPQEIKFTYTGFGKYQVIGFMGDKYFAGYTSNTNPSNPRPGTDFGGISTIANGTLYKVLADDDTRRMISAGNTIALKEGYVIKATDIDLNTRTVLLSLWKDGNEVDYSPLLADETYVYSKNISGIGNLPLIMVRVDNVFSGQEIQAVFLKGLFQISEDATIVKAGNQFGKMEVTGVSSNSITMSNNGSIGLDKNKNDTLMGNIRLKVADSDALRFYFSVDVTPEIVANRLAIDAPAKAKAGDTIRINVTASGNVMDNARVMLGTDFGNTDKDGSLTYTLPKNLNGTYNIIATKTGYENATKDIVIEKYVAIPISDPFFLIATPLKVISGTPINVTFTVLYGSTPVSGATVILTGNATGVGTTDSKGNVTISVNATGAGAITATVTKTGYANTTYPKILTATMPSVSFVANKNTYIQGEKITFTAINNGTIIIDLPSSAPWQVENVTTGEKVFIPIGLTVITPIEPGQSISWTWDQNDEQGKQVPHGIYRSILGSGTGNSYTQDFEILPPQASGANAEREIEKGSLGKGESTNITIKINSSVIQASSLKESIPEGWNLTRISDDADGFKNSTNEWIWSNMTPGITKTVFYAITAPTDAAPGTYYINGTISNSSEVIAVVDGNNIITLDILSYYRGLGGNPDKVETRGLLKAMDDWRSKTVPSGFANPITNQELSALINEWIMS